MESATTSKFRKYLNQLPKDIQNKATIAYELWIFNPTHPSLQFKKIKSSKNTFSVRVNPGYRALGALKGNTIIWYWIGSHDDYERLIQNFK